MAVALVAKWIELERLILKAPDIAGRTESGEEIRLMEKTMMRYATLTPPEMGDAIRKAAESRQRDYAANGGFPKLYIYDIESEFQQATTEKANRKNQAEALALPSNVGGNDFWGEPSEALAREWPRIVEMTKSVRQTLGVKNWRSRFWLIGNHDQRAAAINVLREMNHELHAAGKFDLRQQQWEAMAIWQGEFRAAYPQHIDLIFDTSGKSRLKCPLDHLEIEEVRAKLQRRNAQGENKAEFPERMDAIYSATFDAYWKFKNEV